MTDHPITPPPELVQEWGHDANLSGVPYDDETGHWAYEQHVATQAAQWGADQELEACCEWLVKEGWFRYEHEAVQDLHSARRPKPPSLKEQALEALDRMWTGGSTKGDWELFRRALEALPE